MHKNSLGRRSSSNPVRISLLDREEKSIRTDPRKSQIAKSRARSSSGDNSQIPRPKIRSSSVDASSRKSTLKPTGKIPHGQHGPSNLVTPMRSASKAALTVPLGSTVRGRSPSAERASGIGIGAKGPRKDTRPLTDKAYQSVMLNKIDNYFRMIEKSAMLNSNGSLRPITLKMFVEVSDMLVKLLDIKQCLTMLNYVEELPKIAKKLHYPGVVNKSWLKTANTMHSWPQVLGWLCWLVEVCEAKDLALETYRLERLPFLDTDGLGEENRITFDFMLKAYNAWNEERLDEEIALVDEYLRKIAEMQGITEENLVKAQEDLEREQAKLNVVQEQDRELDEEVKRLEETLKSLREDEAKQDAYLKEKAEYIKETRLQTEQINREYGMLCMEVEKQYTRHKELKVIISQQAMSVVERDEILEKCAELRNYVHTYDNHLGDVEKEIYTLDIKLASVKNRLNKAVLAYNKDIIMHLDQDVGVDLDELKMPETGILGNHIMEELSAKATLMSDLTDDVKRKIAEKKSLIESNNNEFEILQEKVATIEDENKDLLAKFNEKKSCINNIKSQAKAEEAKLKESIKSLQNSIKEIQESMPDVKTPTKELAEAKDKSEALERRKTFLEESAKSFFDSLFQILAAHRNELAEILKKQGKPDPLV